MSGISEPATENAGGTNYKPKLVQFCVLPFHMYLFIVASSQWISSLYKYGH